MGINCQITLPSGNSVTNSAEDNIKRFEGVLLGHQVGESAQKKRGAPRRIISALLLAEKKKKRKCTKRQTSDSDKFHGIVRIYFSLGCFPGMAGKFLGSRTRARLRPTSDL